jgi:hypothetical protein
MKMLPLAVYALPKGLVLRSLRLEEAFYLLCGLSPPPRFKYRKSILARPANARRPSFPLPQHIVVGMPAECLPIAISLVIPMMRNV